MRHPRSSAGIGISAVIALILVVGGISLGLFLQHEKNRELAGWQSTLDLTADARSRELGNWVASQFKELTALSQNASLQIYFTQLPASGAPAASDQAQYLRSLLALTAQRLEFEPTAPSLSQQIGANVNTRRTGGLALADKNGKLLVATAHMPSLEGTLQAAVTHAPRGKPSLLDIETAGDGAQRIGFIVPIYGVQAERSADTQIGSIVGIMPLGDPFYALLAPDARGPKSLEIALLRRDGNSVDYLTPLRDNTPAALHHEEVSETSAAGFAVAHPQQFAEKIDYRHVPVLLTSRQVENTPWTLIAKIDRSEAFAAAAKWRHTVVAAVALLLLTLIATILGIWRNASASQSARLANEAGARAELLAAVTDHQPEPLYILDSDMRLWFTNREAANTMRAKPAELRGKALANVIGHAYAEALAPLVAQTLQQQTPQLIDLERGTGKTRRSIHAQLVPLDHIPVAGLPSPTPGVLVVEQDVTEALSEREQRMQTLQQLVQVIVARIDRRDPYAAEHSALVATVAAGTARSMGLDAATVDTTETAARLMNLGKMDIPSEWLRRDGALKAEERDTIRNSMAMSASLLDGIAFAGPVAETLRQAQEFVDGSGAMKLKGDKILISARIIAAANALVGMLSKRAYRPGMDLTAAMKLLRDNGGKQFDAKVISGLGNYLDNQGGAETLSAAAQSQPAKTTA